MSIVPASTALATLVLALGASSSQAMVSEDDLCLRIQSAVDSGSVIVQVQGDTAYLSGWVGDSLERNAVARVALGTSGIEHVVNTVLY